MLAIIFKRMEHLFVFIAVSTIAPVLVKHAIHRTAGGLRKTWKRRPMAGVHCDLHVLKGCAASTVLTRAGFLQIFRIPCESFYVKTIMGFDQSLQRVSVSDMCYMWHKLGE